MIRLTPSSAAIIRGEIEQAGGNEVCFIARVAEDGAVADVRVVARGHKHGVVAAARGAAAGSLVIHNHPSGVIEPSDADLEVAAELHGRGIGLAITDNRALELYVVVEPARVRPHEPLDASALAALLAPGGPIERAHGAYEDRPSQRAFTEAVAGRYNGGGILLAEAGTGTGKSVAYLLPAIAWAARNRERTIVSTNTINLQEQLVAKDLPFLRRALGAPFRFALVKGRRNYVSIRRAYLAAAGSASLFETPAQRELDAIVAWLRETRDGSLQDLPFTPSPEVWDEVASETDVCMRTRCPHFEACFYQRARRDAAAADVLVVNHHLLFSDAAVRRAQGNYTASAVLPPYRRLILDEAHNVEDAATEHLGAMISRRGLMRLLGRLDRRGRGILQTVADRLLTALDDPLRDEALEQIDTSLRPSVERARDLAVRLFEGLERISGVTPEAVVRLDPSLAAEPDWANDVEPLIEGLVLALDGTARAVDRLRERIQRDERWFSALEEQCIELEAAADRMRGAARELRVALRFEEEDVPLVRWIERRAGAERANVVVRAAPIEVGQVLREAIFDPVDTVVLTSATLSANGDFEFVRGRLGLDGRGMKLVEAAYPSPFEFETQALLAVPTDLPVPRGEASDGFDSAVAGVVQNLAGITDGGVFVLFTSYRSLRRVARDLRDRGVEARWPMFVQGEAARAALLAGFARSGDGLLLGVASFWEGVDVPGAALRGLIITKLPFRVPTEPLTAARLETIEATGGDSFRDYMLPHAALRLKQGFGRLIRTRTDRGAVVLLDRRVLERSYGRLLLSTLPPAPLVAGRWTEIVPRLAAFYRGAPEAGWRAVDSAAGEAGFAAPPGPHA